MRIRSALLFSSALITGTAPALEISFTIQYENCSEGNGWIQASVYGGTAPYSYDWTPDPAIGEGTEVASGLSAGWYYLTVTDDLGTQLTDSIQLLNLPNLEVFQTINQQLLYACPGECNGAFSVHEQFLGGTGPYAYFADQGGYLGTTEFDGNPMFGPYCGGEILYLEVTDNLGCQGITQIEIEAPVANSMQITEVLPACQGGMNGSISLTVANDPFFGSEIHLLDASLNEIDWYPQVPEVTFSQLGSGHYVIERVWYLINPDCRDTIGVDIPEDFSCGAVNGTLFIDHDQDCVQDPGDVGIPYAILNIEPGGELAITNANGAYARSLPFGSFTLQEADPLLYPLCPVGRPVPFDLSAGTPLVTVDLADSSLIPLDLDVFWTYAEPPRPGFTVTYHAAVRNLSGQLSGPVTVTFTFDALQDLEGTYPTPTNVVGNVITWDLPAFGSFGIQSFDIALSLPPDVGLIGTQLFNTFTAGNTLLEATLANNEHVFSPIVVASFDPNDKTVEPGPIFLVEEDSVLTYTIRFQNTGTFLAETVVITDTLSTELDMNTFLQGAASHAFTIEFKPQRVVQWTFSNINLPDSSTDEPGSHGSVSFRIRPGQPWLPGTEIVNNADIFFDFNPPIRTNDAVVLIESTTLAATIPADGFRLVPNPAQGELFVLGLERMAPLTSAHIRTIDGRVVMELSSPVRTVDVRSLPAGVYVLSLGCNDGAVRSQRFVKQ